MTKLVLPFVETMITQSCNLSCAGCSNYSDLPHSGYLTWAEGSATIEPWLERVSIPDFGIIGGEPLMNPQVEQWLIGIRKLLPNSQIRFTTNGLLLHRYPDLLELLEQIGNCVFKITVHQSSPELENYIKQVLDTHTWTTVVEHGITRYKSNNGVRFQIKRPNIFYKTFQGNYEDMRPHANSPSDAFEVCTQQSCPLLYQGRLYKCSTSALLKDVLTRVRLENNPAWQPYVIPGLDSTCSETELISFINNFNQPHSICAMCPSAADSASRLDHFNTVATKKYIIQLQ